MAFDIEVIFIALWALVFGDVINAETVEAAAVSPAGAFFGMLLFVGIMEISVLYAAKKGLLTWK